MSAPADSPTALARAVQLGQPDALGRWYELEWPTIYRLAFGLLAEPNEAEDLAQDAMLHLSDRMDRWDSTRSYEAWRTRVVMNLGRDRLRRTAARRKAELGAAEQGSSGRAWAQNLPAPNDANRADDVRAALTKALGALPEREREAFVLLDLEGVGAAVAAEVMGVGRSTVRSLLSLARRRLRDLLAPSFFPSATGGTDV